MTEMTTKQWEKLFKTFKIEDLEYILPQKVKELRATLDRAENLTNCVEACEKLLKERDM